MLSCTDLTFSYQGTPRVKGVGFTVAASSLFALFGHNGSGKSTLLKMLGGSLPIRSGTVTFMGEPAIGRDGFLRRDIRSSFGVLFQTSSSDEKLSAYDNLFFCARMYGLGRDQAHARALWALKHATLEERAHEPVKKLSGGMRRRLELYRCFVHAPKVIVLDEPTAGLDVAEVSKFFGFLAGYRAETRAAIIMASHQADELLFANHVAMMKDGVILEHGSPNAMLAQLDYLRCSFSLDGTHALRLADLHLYDAVNESDGSITAKFKAHDLDDFLKQPLLRDAAFRSFAIIKPSLADVYRDMLQRNAS